MKASFFKVRPNILVCLFLVISVLSVYLQVRHHAFINYDDTSYVTENTYVQAGLTLESVIWSFTETHSANWHPITWLSHMLDIQLYGMVPGRHHLTNVLFHIGNTLLLFLVFRRMTGVLWRSAFVAALFALHPLHVESVAWVAERKDVLSTFFWMLTMGAYAWYVERPGLKRYLLVLLLFVLGLMAKPMLVTLPFVLLLLDFWPLRRFYIGHLKGRGVLQRKSVALHLVWEKTPLFALAAASSVVTFLVQKSAGAVGSFTLYPIDVRITNALVSYVDYIGTMFYPSHLTVLYPHPGMLPWWQILGSSLFLACIFILAIIAVKRYPWFAFGWLWYIGTLVPVIGLVQVGSQAMSDRYTYVPLIGIFIIVAWGIPELLSGWRNRKIGLPTMAVACLLVLMTTTWFQVRYWANSVTLFEHALNVVDNKHLAHYNLGLALVYQGKIDDAYSHFLVSLEAYPNLAKAHNNIGIALVRKGKLEEAIGHFRGALRIKPDYTNAQNNLQRALTLVGK